ncbi:MAG TPA: outer-membrane lipoprotein carrier protein LolA [Spirochaetota bacterium]|nr:outer-membrane lipoprotein carrier protein LolA [Spirochaetota bacterium]
MKKCFILFLFLFVTIYFSFSQDELVSAKELLQKLSVSFKSNVKDLEAEIKWIQDKETQKGTLFYKNPQKIRINFTDPSNQVICSNGYMLWVYIDYLNLILKQEILQKEKTKTEEGKSQTVINPLLINPVGYDRFLTEYAIEYNETKTQVDYKDGSKVYQFKLFRWKSSKGGFNTILLTISATDGLIRRVEGITATYKRITLELDNIKLNKNISDITFNYEPPAHANTVDNFITNQGDGQ